MHILAGIDCRLLLHHDIVVILLFYNTCMRLCYSVLIERGVVLLSFLCSWVGILHSILIKVGILISGSVLYIYMSPGTCTCRLIRS